jgi:hypothetical protein
LSQLTIEALSRYLQTRNSEGLNAITLNNCGLSGKLLAHLFNSIGQGREMVVSISSNPLENEGMDAFCQALAFNYNPTALYMDMIEFTSEADFIRLLRSLTVNKTIRLLSVAGTATRGQVSEQACNALSTFFSQNQTIEYLDMSGYSALLDEAQLGLGFSRSLAGLADNKTLRHLRIRHQKLNFNVGDLAKALQQNKSVLTVDILDNGFSLSNLSFLVNSMEKNTNILQLVAFDQQALQNAIDASIENLMPRDISRPQGQVKKRSSDSEFPPAMQELAHHLQVQWTAQVGHLRLILQRNKRLKDDAENWKEAYMKDSSEEWYAELFGGLAPKLAEEAKPKGSAIEEVMRAEKSALRKSESDEVGSSSGRSFGQLVMAPHHVSKDEVINSPMTEGAGEGAMGAWSGTATTPELAYSPGEYFAPGAMMTTGAAQSPDTNPQTPEEDDVDDLQPSLVDLMRKHGI